MKIDRLLVEGVLFALSRVSSSVLLFVISWYSVTFLPSDQASNVLLVVLINATSAAVDGGLAIASLSLASCEPSKYRNNRGKRLVAFALWAVLCSLAYISMLLLIPFFSNLSSGQFSKTLSQLSSYGLLLAICTTGNACQRVLVAIGETKKQMLGLLVMTFFSLVLFFLATVIITVPVIYVVIVLVVGCPLADSIIYVFWVNGQEPCAFSWIQFLKSLFKEGFFFGVLQCVPLVAFLSDLSILSFYVPLSYSNSYGAIQRTSILIVTAYSLILIPRWRTSHHQLHQSRDTSDRLATILPASVVFTSVGCGVVFFLSLYALRTAFMKAEIEPPSALLAFGFSILIAVQIVGAYVGIYFSRCSGRHLLLYVVPAVVSLFLFVKILLAQFSPDLFPLVTAVLLLFLSVVPQIVLSLIGSKSFFRES